jgi:hypothetical protein
MRHYDNVWELFRDSKYKNECEAYLAAYKLTEDDLNDLLMENNQLPNIEARGNFFYYFIVLKNCTKIEATGGGRSVLNPS